MSITAILVAQPTSNAIEPVGVVLRPIVAVGLSPFNTATFYADTPSNLLGSDGVNYLWTVFTVLGDPTHTATFSTTTPDLTISSGMLGKYLELQVSAQSDATLQSSVNVGLINTINDSAENISTYLDVIQQNISIISSLVVTNPTVAVTFTVAQALTTDVSALALIHNHGLTAIVDTAANLAANLAGLNNSLGQLNSIVVNDNHTVYITPTERIADAGALALIVSGGGSYTVVPDAGSVATFLSNYANLGVNTFAISDTAANISANIGALNNALTNIGSITQSDLGTPIRLTQAQLNSDGSVLNAIGGNYSLAILNASMYDFMTDVSNSHVVSVGIVDSSPIISGEFVARSYAAINHLWSKASSIVTTDNNPILINGGQMSAAIGTFGQVSGTYAVNVTSAVTAAQFVSNPI